MLLIGLAFLAGSALAKTARKMNYYERLGVARNADLETIKKAYRDLMKIYHPDLTQGDKTKEEEAKEINVAYDVLSDDRKRPLYNTSLLWAELLTDFGPRPTRSATAPEKPKEETAPQRAPHQELALAAIPERVALEMWSFAGQSRRDLIDQAVRLMDREIVDFRKAPLQDLKDEAHMNLAAKDVQSFWLNMAMWTRNTQDKLELTEAILAASFLYLKQFQHAAPRVFNAYYDSGIEMMRLSYAAMLSQEATLEMAEMFKRLYDFANLYRVRPWNPTGYEQYLRSQQCESTVI